jgi:pimeloyl-ACP methyl ester carboxylesterase
MPAVTLAAWRAAGATFSWRGHAIFTRSDGAGEPLLLIHGFPTASWDWHPLWAPLAARFRLITLDMLGFGFSAKPRDHAYRIVDQADLYEAALAREGVTRLRVLAHDYGNTVAQELLARQRDGALATRIEAVVFLNGGLFPEAHHPLMMQRLLASRLGPVLVKLSGYRTFARSLRRIWGERPPPEDELRAMWELVTHNDGVPVLPKLLGYLAQRRANRARWVGAVTEAGVPLRLIDGLRDPISGTSLVARYRQLVRDPDVVELPAVGHYPQLEAPDAVLAATLDFFKGGFTG